MIARHVNLIVVCKVDSQLATTQLSIVQISHGTHGTGLVLVLTEGVALRFVGLTVVHHAKVDDGADLVENLTQGLLGRVIGNVTN